MSAESPHTVLIVGAGLSSASDARLPTMRGFFGPELSTRPELLAFLKWFYPGQSQEMYNLEEVMSFLHLSSTRLPLWRDRRQPGQLRSNGSLYESLLSYVRDRLAISPGTICTLHRRLFETLSQRDSIISFNYDLIADNALLAIEPKQNNRPDQDTRMGKVSGLLGRLNLWNDPPPSLLPRERNWGFYLKLHGSLDWLYCETEGCENNANIFALSVSELADGQEEGMPCRFCGASLRTFIVPPVATKRLKDTGRMAFLWNIALRQLISADRIVVVGISFAPSDFELRWLVRQAIELRETAGYELHVVNPSSDDRQNTIAVFPGADRKVCEHDSVAEYIAKEIAHCKKGPGSN